ncbi:MAG: hypothetical protein J5685_00460 [Clostridiales bacterium]|nr:hypothetical protein [Clostridiales bacterium]
MKAFKLPVTLLLVISVIAASTSCSKQVAEETEETEWSMPSVITTSEGNSEEEEAQVEEETVPTPTPVPEDEWPQIELSGNKDDRITVTQNSYYEGEDFFLFAEEGVTLRGSAAEDIERIMGELEDLYDLSFDTNDHITGDINWRELYMDGDFGDINNDCYKVNIVVINDPHDGTVQWGHETVAVLFEQDLMFEDDENTDIAFYHEMTHALQLRNGRVSNVFSEGMAVYSQYAMCLNDEYPNYSTLCYVYDGLAWGDFSVEDIISDPEGEYAKTYDDYELTYLYGVRFVAFLMDTYGPEIFGRLCDAAYDYETQNNDIYALHDDPQLSIDVIKSCTSDDVFEQFSVWLSESWPEYGQTYADFLISQGVEVWLP